MSWFDRQSERLAGECRVGDIDPGELARALADAVARLEGVDPSTAEHVMGGGMPVEPYVSEAVDLERFDYFLGLVDESGGRERSGWGDFADER